MPPPPNPGSDMYVGAITLGYGPAAPGIGPYWPLAAAPSSATPAAASMKVLVRMEVSSSSGSWLRTRHSPTHRLATHPLSGYTMPAEKNRPLQPANRDFLEHSAN